MRPEHSAPPEEFYNDIEAVKYTQNSRIQEIQAEMTLRALELLNLDQDTPAYLLDIGCGSGLSGEIIQEEGHYWVGMDIAPAMLQIAIDREVEGDLFWQDAGEGMGFRPGTFDGAISISVLQWLCNADHAANNPKQRLQRFFSTLYSSLRRGARAVFQFYPENDNQVELIMSTAMRCGFEGGLVVDFPNSKKAKKFFLCLFAGQDPDAVGKPQMPAALGEDLADGEEGRQVTYEGGRRDRPGRKGKDGKRKGIKDREWVLKKKDLYRKRGKNVPLDTKYTARKRSKPTF